MVINGKNRPCACFGGYTECATCDINIGGIGCGFRNKCQIATKEVNQRQSSSEISRILLTASKDGRTKKRVESAR